MLASTWTSRGPPPVRVRGSFPEIRQQTRRRLSAALTETTNFGRRDGLSRSTGDCPRGRSAEFNSVRNPQLTLISDDEQRDDAGEAGRDFKRWTDALLGLTAAPQGFSGVEDFALVVHEGDAERCVVGDSGELELRADDVPFVDP